MIEVQSIDRTNTTTDDSLIDGAFIERDLGIARRSRFNYRRRGLLPPPDTNLLGRNLWRLSTYRQFKDDLMAGKFGTVRLAPARRAFPKNLKSPTASPRDRLPLTRATHSASDE
jgi:hypothetical protein